MAYLIPAEFVTKMVDAGESKIFMSTRDTLIRAFMAGAILALAAVFAVTVSVQTGSPLAGAMLFPVGFIMLYLMGFDLLTGVFVLTPLAWLDKRPGVTINGILRNWGLVFCGNFAGAVTVALMMAFVFTMGFDAPAGPVGEKLAGVGEARTLGYAEHGVSGWFTIFLRGMLCNWMVSMGVVGAMVSTNVSGKVIAMWMPIMLFFYMVFEHSVVNMFLFPFALLMGGDFSMMDYLLWNEIPTVLGNLVGGLAFTGLTLYSTHYKTAPKRDLLQATSFNTSKKGCLTVSLQLQIGQHSTAGRKSVNQDFVDFSFPINAALLRDKGAVLAIADGIGSSQVSQIASETAVRSFILDYFATNPAWSVKHAAQQVLQACHRWLYQQNKQSSYGQDPDKGYCCAFSALILRQHQAHLFHIGDCRIYQFRQGQLSQLTRDQRAWQANQLLLSQALGAQPGIAPDYLQLDLAGGDLYLLATDGFFEFIEQSTLASFLAQINDTTDLHLLAQRLVETAITNGSDDNISVQLAFVIHLPQQHKLPGGWDDDLPLPPILQTGSQIDGLKVLQVMSQNNRSHLYLVELANTKKAVLKAPSLELAGDNHYLEKLLREEWIANRVHSPYILRAAQTEHQRSAIYSLFEYIPGQTLADWHLTQPLPDLEVVLQIIEQTGKALQALHRAEILHQDIRPNNVMLDTFGQIRVIDFGAARLAGLQSDQEVAGEIPGTALFTAPEYFTGQAGTTRSDLYALAALCYFLLTGQSPYGPDIARCKNLLAQQRLTYQPIIGQQADWPEWLDLTLQKALQVDPEKRYQHLSEFLYDLRHPNPSLGRELTLQAAYPIRIWQTLCFVQALLITFLLVIN